MIKHINIWGSLVLDKPRCVDHPKYIDEMNQPYLQATSGLLLTPRFTKDALVDGEKDLTRYTVTTTNSQTNIN